MKISSKARQWCLAAAGSLACFSGLMADDLRHTPSKLYPPISSDGSALFYYQNKSDIENGNVFIQVVGVNPQTGAQCFIQYGDNGLPSYKDVQEGMVSETYAYPLSHFPTMKVDNKHVIYLPRLDGARIYTSLHKKVSFLVNQNEKGVWTINAPNPLDPNDPNRFTFWDKTEFAVNSEAVFINPTAVDDFALPLHCAEYGNDGTTQSGGITASRIDVFNLINDLFTKAGAPWIHLISQTPSLVYSPMFGAATGLFPQDYFVTTGWIDAFKQLFSEHALKIDAEESLPISKGGGIWQGFIDPKTSIITFKRVVDATHPMIPPVQVTLPILTSELIGGNGPGWKIQNANPLQALIARDLSCAIDTNTLTTTEILSLKYFKSVSSNFYQINKQLPIGLQFIDYYSKALHSFGDHQIYTIPYDDELGQSGAASYTPQNYNGGLISLGPI